MESQRRILEGIRHKIKARAMIERVHFAINSEISLEQKILSNRGKKMHRALFPTASITLQKYGENLGRGIEDVLGREVTYKRKAFMFFTPVESVRNILASESQRDLGPFNYAAMMITTRGEFALFLSSNTREFDTEKILGEYLHLYNDGTTHQEDYSDSAIQRILVDHETGNRFIALNPDNSKVVDPLFSATLERIENLVLREV